MSGNSRTMWYAVLIEGCPTGRFRSVEEARKYALSIGQPDMPVIPLVPAQPTLQELALAATTLRPTSSGAIALLRRLNATHRLGRPLSDTAAYQRVQEARAIHATHTPTAKEDTA